MPASTFRNRRTAALLLAGLLALGGALAPASRGQQTAPEAPVRTDPAATPAPAAAAQPPVPVRITAEKAEYLDAENKVVFTGKVVAIRGDATLTADRMDVVFSPAKDPGAAQAQARIRSIVATQNVTFRQVDPQSRKERYGVGERGEYDADAKVVTLTGKPRVWEGKNVMTGEKMQFFLDGRRVEVDGKVNLTVYPDETPSPGKGATREPGAKPGREGGTP